MSDVASAKKGRKDLYANLAQALVTMSAANTITFAQLITSVGLFQGVAMLLHRILWTPTLAACREVVAATDTLMMALTVSNRVSSLGDVLDPSIIGSKTIVGIGIPVANWELPLITDFSGLPQGGKLIPASPLFLAANTAGFAAAATVRAQLDFSFIQLSDSDYLELLQSMYPIAV